MNTKYGKLTGGVMEYAPSQLCVNGAVIVNPTRATYLRNGYKKVIEGAADDPPDGEEWKLTGWHETAEAYIAEYESVARTIPPRTFSKLKLVAALTAAGHWAAVKDWLVESDYYDLFIAAQCFCADYPAFAEGLAAAKSRFGWDDAAVEALLAKCMDA